MQRKRLLAGSITVLLCLLALCAFLFSGTNGTMNADAVKIVQCGPLWMQTLPTNRTSALVTNTTAKILHVNC
jgi:hypothetical protein